MLEKIYIKNYVIIKELSIPFEPNFNVITGETGAGKSIILGALSLILGERADSQVILNPEEKCIIEGHFNISGNHTCREILRQHDLDVETHTIIRREINAQGKSRAFINDSPVNLGLLNEFTSQLVDLHRQFDNLAVKDHLFAFQIIDALAGNQDLLHTYQQQYREHQRLQKQLQELTGNRQAFRQELDYKQFLLQELEDFAIRDNELEQLADEARSLEHADEIRQNINSVLYMLEEDENAVNHQVRKMLQVLQQTSRIYPGVTASHNRLDSAWIELKDIREELEKSLEGIDTDPQQLAVIQERLDTGYKLLKKHGVRDSAELIAVQQQLQSDVQKVLHIDEDILNLEEKVAGLAASLNEQAQQLHRQRNSAIAPFEAKVNEYIHLMGMVNADFRVDLQPVQQLDHLGKSAITFMLDSNKSGRYAPVQRAASGGELSRIMLAVKTITARAIELPTLIFDEVDTGISGEAAKQVGTLMKELGACHQIICITHQPQVAAKAHQHYFVYKQEDEQQRISTSIRRLDESERVTAIAQMIGGNQLTDAALNNAKELMR